MKAHLVNNIPEPVVPATISKRSTADAKSIHKDADKADQNRSNYTEDATVVVVAFEACTSCHRFAKKAREIYAELCELVPADSNVRLELSINGDGGDTTRTKMKVRRGAFEISVYNKMADDKRVPKEIWTGLKRGPPRKNKYPETKNVLDDILSLYK